LADGVVGAELIPYEFLESPDVFLDLLLIDGFEFTEIGGVVFQGWNRFFELGGFGQEELMELTGTDRPQPEPERLLQKLVQLVLGKGVRQ